MRRRTAVTWLAVAVAVGLFGLIWFDHSARDDARLNQEQADVNDAFWDKVVRDGSSSYVEPESGCRRLDEGKYRCYARWAPNSQNQVFIYHADVDVYDGGQIVVYNLDRVREGELSGT